MKLRINNKLRKMVATAKINHLRAVINRNKFRDPLGINSDWELEAEIEHWQDYISKLNEVTEKD